MTLPRIYLDNASTSWPKPQAVYEAMDDYNRRLGAVVGRGGYVEAVLAAQAVEQARSALAHLIGAASADHVFFAFNGTDALNLALHGLLRPGDHVISTVVEHNSVLRPLRLMERSRQVQVTRVGCDAAGLVDPQHFREVLQGTTRLVVVSHASNVTGAIQPVEEISRIAHEFGALVLVDAAQTLGHLPLAVDDLGADLLAAPGHKGLLGPLGTGLLYLRPGLAHQLDSLRQGGTGSASSNDQQPDTLPDKYESGNQNLPGIVGLGAAVEYLLARGIDQIRSHELALTEQLLAGLSAARGIEIVGPARGDQRVGVVSISVPPHDPLAVARQLEQEFRVQTRAGFQCAALLHHALGTQQRGGTVRLSLSALSTAEQIDAAVTAIMNLTQRPPLTAERAADCPCVGLSSVGAECTASNQAFYIETARLPGLSEVWEHTRGDGRVRIAVLDGPVDLAHPAFDGALLNQGKVTPAELRGSSAQHGTHVASVIFGQPGGPVAGIAPGCSGMSIPIFGDDEAGGIAACSQQQLARAIGEALSQGAHIINVSGGQLLPQACESNPSGSECEVHPELERAVQHCHDRGVLLVAAAGNDGCECVHIPGALPSVLVVGALDRSGDPLTLSNWGSAYQESGLVAPGEAILGALPGGGVVARSGTSFATPIVSGVAGLLMSLHLEHGMSLDAQRVRRILLNSVDPCNSATEGDCGRVLMGKLNISNALTLANQGEDTMSVTTTGAAGPTEPYRFNARPTADSLCTLAPLSGNCVQPEAGGAIVPAGTVEAALPRADLQVAVEPSGCGCEGGSGLVYVIGDLAHDFGTQSNFNSLSNNIDYCDVFDSSGNLIRHVDVQTVRGVLEYLLGYRLYRSSDQIEASLERRIARTRRDPSKVEINQAEEEKIRASIVKGWVEMKQPHDDDESPPNTTSSQWYRRTACGHLYDAKLIYWVIKHEECPKYAVRPSGVYGEAEHLELLRFLIDFSGIDPFEWVEIPGADPPTSKRLRLDCFKPFFCCHGGPVCSPRTAFERQVFDAADDNIEELLQEQLSKASHVAFPGHLSGKARLYAGDIVETINPSMRTSKTWNTYALLSPFTLDVQNALLFKVVGALYDAVRNDGKSPQERALNFAATEIIGLLGPYLDSDAFLDAAVDGKVNRKNLALDSIGVHQSRCQRADGAAYDVEIIFYDSANQFRARTVVAFTVDVAEVNPSLNDQRFFQKR